MVTATVDGTTISVGGGVQYLSLPDIRFNFITNDTGTTLRKYNNSNFEEYGPAATARIETPIGQWGSQTVFGAVHGFFASIEDSERHTCHPGAATSCSYDNIVDTDIRDKFPARGNLGPLGAGALLTNTSRDVDFWGVGLEAKVAGPQRNYGLVRQIYWAAGGDVRGLDQDIGIRGSDNLQGRIFDYSENLDTTYYGGYLALGGEYSLFPSLYAGWGLRSFLTAQVGVYDAETDYSGHYRTPAGPLVPPPANSRLSLSDSNVAVIASVKSETRKQFGPRTSLSWLSEYEWYSWAPEMHYNDSDVIGGVDAFPGRFSYQHRRWGCLFDPKLLALECRAWAAHDVR